jgi:hypothetical protein
MLRNPLKHEAPERRSPKAPEKHRSGDLPLQRSGEKCCVVLENILKHEVLKHRNPKALDKRHIGKFLVLTRGHMSFGPK